MISALRLPTIAMRVALAGLIALAFAGRASAANATFPMGSALGIVPPAGMVTSDAFPGFKDVDKNAVIVLGTLPPAAYAEMEKGPLADTLKKQGINFEKREPMQLSFGKGFLVTGTEVADKTRYRKWILVAAADGFTVFVNAQAPDNDKTYTDAVMRAALATLALRTSIPDAERLGLLPFAVGDLAGFHIETVLPGRALTLVETEDSTVTARLVIAALEGGPSEAEDRARFARLAFGSIAGIKDVRLTMSEPLRLGGQAGFQTMAQAKDAGTDADVMVVQWLRFGSGGFMEMVGIAKADTWTETLARLRTVRDSVEPR